METHPRHVRDESCLPGTRWPADTPCHQEPSARLTRLGACRPAGRNRAETPIADALRCGSLSGVLYAEDMPVDRRFDLGTYAVSAGEIKRFAALWDPLPDAP
jgi:hypothetical protein